MNAYFLYTIKPISNLHVGSGAVNFGVVDNLIQRDALTDLPNINASSLKGALREYFTNQENEEKIDIKAVFGSPVKGDERNAGNYRFFDANLLAIPVRSDKVPFFLAICPLVINDFIQKAEVFNINVDNIAELKSFADKAEEGKMLVFNENQADAFVEDMETETEYLEFDTSGLSFLFGSHPLLLLSDSQFKMLCNDNHLPVIARNQLDKGKSKNLFYEQVIPRFSIFYFIVVVTGKGCLPLEDKLIQIGANASVGYGFCKFKQIYPSQK